MNQIKTGRKNRQITNHEIFDEFEMLINEIASLKKIVKPLKNKKTYNYKEAAELLHLSLEGLKTRIKRGQIKRISNGGKPMISIEEIERYLKNQNPEY